MLPPWGPLRAPRTDTAVIAEAGTPRKLICVWGLAEPVSGAGETLTAVPARAAL